MFALYQMRMCPNLKGDKMITDAKILISEEEASDIFGCLSAYNIEEKISKGFKNVFPWRKGCFSREKLVFKTSKEVIHFFSIFKHIKPETGAYFVRENKGSKYSSIEGSLFHQMKLDPQKLEEYSKMHFPKNGCRLMSCELAVGELFGRKGNFEIEFTRTPPLSGGYLKLIYAYQTFDSNKYQCLIAGKSKEPHEQFEDCSYEEWNMEELEKNYPNLKSVWIEYKQDFKIGLERVNDERKLEYLQKKKSQNYLKQQKK